MTIDELHKWATKYNVLELPLYGSDDDGEFSGMQHEAAEDEGELSECCGAERDSRFPNSDLCGECQEHAEFKEGLPERIRLKI
ncbi:MAG: hypothetical protein GY804_02440 [Alphaproteobacteria bacterium]|nr:hypothetical protein [Alphaproteobacteria bacterium]